MNTRTRSVPVVACIAMLVLSGRPCAGNSLYVDALAQPGGDGGESTPFMTIPAALAVAGEGDSIRILGGGGRVYYDLTNIVNAANVTLTSHGGEMPHILITNTVGVLNNTEFLRLNQPGCTVNGLLFDIYAKTVEAGGRIIGISTNASNTTVENCVFDVNTSSPWGMFNAANRISGTANGAITVLVENQTRCAHNTVVRGNTFRNWDYGDGSRACVTLLAGNNLVFENNVVTNGAAAIRGNSNATLNNALIAGNIILNCRNSGQALVSGAYAGLKSGTIRHNIIMNTPDGVMYGKGCAISKSREGLNSTMVIHNNTVIGLANFMLLSSGNFFGNEFSPVIVNNLCSLTGPVIYEQLPSGAWYSNNKTNTSFKVASRVHNNIYDDTLAGFYDSADPLSPFLQADLGEYAATFYDNNPRTVTFKNTADILHEHYMRPVSEHFAAIRMGRLAGGEFPNYIGARDALSEPGTFLIFR